MLNICLPFNLEVDPHCVALAPMTRVALAASSPSKASSTSAVQHHYFPTCPPNPLGPLTAFLPQFPSGKTREPLFIASNANRAGWWAKHMACLLLAWLTQIFSIPTFFCPSPTLVVLSLLVPVPSWSSAPSAQCPPLNYGPFKKKQM